jgi:hypothetical protein
MPAPENYVLPNKFRNVGEVLTSAQTWTKNIGRRASKRVDSRRRHSPGPGLEYSLSGDRCEGMKSETSKENE